MVMKRTYMLLVVNGSNDGSIHFKNLFQMQDEVYLDIFSYEKIDFHDFP
jgi:hypothetical protein